MVVQQVLRMPINDNVNGVDQSLKIPFLYKGRSEIRHDEVAHEHSPLIRQVNEHGIVSLPALNRNELDARSTDLQLSATIDCDVLLETPDVVYAEALAEELLVE